MSKYIYCSSPARAPYPWPLVLFFFTSTAVCRPPLLPFHTVITHLYTRQALCPREVREKRERERKKKMYLLSFSSLIFFSFLFLAHQFIAHARARVHSRNELRVRSRTHLHFGGLNKKVKKTI